MNPRYWLLFEKSDKTRISKGIDGYLDKTGESYDYDNLVPNHKQLRSGDSVVLRKEDEILGVAKVAEISHKPDVKAHRRCPSCQSTDIRERTTKTPKWKCGNCSFEFPKAEQSTVQVQSYTAVLQDFASLNPTPSVTEVKVCAVDPNGRSSQLSILELDPGKIRTLLEARFPPPFNPAQELPRGGQGFGLSQAERREIELHAMRIARELYEREGWTLVDTSSCYPYDLLATRGEERRFIEVKGTTGAGDSVILTQAELRHARQHTRSSALVVVSQITLTNSNSTWVASGGNVTTHEDPWIILDDQLEPTAYRYKTHRSLPTTRDQPISVILPPQTKP